MVYIYIYISLQTGDANVLIKDGNPRKGRESHDEDEASYKPWLKDLQEGERIDHLLLPLVYRVDSV